METTLKGMKSISLPDGIYIIGGTEGDKETNKLTK